MCLECLKPVEGWAKAGSGRRCPRCSYPVCGPACAGGARHREECALLARHQDWGEELPTYAPITPLRMLLLQERGGDPWQRWGASG